jgi:heme O synthase-like polyprenyltransferase
MSLKSIRIWATLFVLICVVALVAINLIPRGNFITAPAITLFVYAPLMIVQIVLLIQIWTTDETEIRARNWFFYSCLLITLIFIYFFYHFLKNTS